MQNAVLQSLGGLGLFLLGMGLLTDGLKSLAGPSMRRLLRRWTHTPTTGAISGAIVTTIVQSSSVTTVTAVGLVGAGVLTFPHALGIIFGANIGTTITGWMVALLGFKISLASVAMPMLLGGVLLRLLARDRLAAIGHAVAGFAVIFIGITFLKDGMAGFGDVLTSDTFPGDDIAGRLQLVGIGILITIVTQSSSAGVATAIAAVYTGTIGFGQAAAMVIGMDVGTTITAFLATVGGSPAAKRTGYSHVIYNLMTGVMAFALLTPYLWAVDAFGGSEDPELFLVGFHTLFNTLGVILVLPFAGRFAALIERLVPSNEAVLTRHLEPKLLKEPDMALEAAQATILEVTAWAMEILRPIFAGRAQQALTSALAPMDDALIETHSFVEDLSKVQTSKDVAGRVVHMMYASDHLDRIVTRLRAQDRVDTVIANSELRHAASELDSIAGRLQSWARDPGTDSVVADAEQAWRLLTEYTENYRQTIIGAATSGKLGVDSSLAQLDAMRWLLRVAHHLWRLAYHLETARSKAKRRK